MARTSLVVLTFAPPELHLLYAANLTSPTRPLGPVVDVYGFTPDGGRLGIDSGLVLYGQGRREQR